MAVNIMRTRISKTDRKVNVELFVLEAEASRLIREADKADKKRQYELKMFAYGDKARELAAKLELPIHSAIERIYVEDKLGVNPELPLKKWLEAKESASKKRFANYKLFKS